MARGVAWLSGCATFTNTETVEVYAVHRTPEATELELGIRSCTADLAAIVDETASEVVITVAARHDTSDDCADSMRVALDEPLGDRIVIDGSRTVEVPVDPAES